MIWIEIFFVKSVRRFAFIFLKFSIQLHLVHVGVRQSGRCQFSKRKQFFGIESVIPILTNNTTNSWHIERDDLVQREEEDEGREEGEARVERGRQGEEVLVVDPEFRYRSRTFHSQHLRRNGDR